MAGWFAQVLRMAAASPLLFACIIATPSARAELAPSDGDRLCEYVAAGSELALRYFEDPSDAEARIVAPGAVGVTTKNNSVLIGMQISGYSKSASEGRGKLPDWRSFRFDRIVSIEPTGKTNRQGKPDADALRYVKSLKCSADKSE